ncbi:hypothetical protein [Croceibacterium ferulae]|uniref:hypothetical protein n=1 Tax=Croceibacterium ferulae TaxID=1854641 RepID=UPI000EB56F00|nr:hypothetical protein [Croceibacterium ferulae]
MTDENTPSGLKKLPVYSRAELMEALGLQADEIDRLLLHPWDVEYMLATLSRILDYLRSIYDLDESRVPGYLKRHHLTFESSPLAIMLRDEDGARRIAGFLASEVYSLW